MIFKFRRKQKTLPSLSNRRFLSEEAFSAVLEHERLRTERTERTFCLLQLNDRSRKSELATVLERIDAGAIRRTDAAGHFRDGVGVMLPETGIEGAQHVQRKLTDELGVKCQVFVFPSEVLPEEVADDVDDVTHDKGPTDGSNDGARHSTKQLQAETIESVMVLPEAVMKRTLDIVGAVTGLLILSPVILASMLLVKLSSKGPIFFMQRRAGQGGRPFTMLKLRTMVVNAEELQTQLRAKSEQDGPAFKLKHDPRITPIGRFLRKSCIDELPQLWNVLMGHMSIVGPRPLPVSESAQIEPWARMRLRVKPGLTCIWQVDGGPHVTFDEWMRMDIQYILGQTFSRDLKLIMRTAANVVLHRAST